MKEVVVIFEHEIGDLVEIIHAKDIEGRVCTHINGIAGKQYRVCWWNNGSRIDEVLYAWEIRAAKQH